MSKKKRKKTGNSQQIRDKIKKKITEEEIRERTEENKGVSNKWQQWMRSDGDRKKRKRENERTEKKREKGGRKGEG